MSRSITRSALHRNRKRRAISTTDLGGLLCLLSAHLSFQRPARWNASRATAREMASVAELLSLLSAQVPWACRTRVQRGQVKVAIMDALAFVSHYESRDTHAIVDPGSPRSQSVGLSYREIRTRIRAAFPGAGVSLMTIRAYARDAKKREDRPLPYRRPYSRRTRG